MNNSFITENVTIIEITHKNRTTDLSLTCMNNQRKMQDTLINFTLIMNTNFIQVHKTNLNYICGGRASSVINQFDCRQLARSPLLLHTTLKCSCSYFHKTERVSNTLKLQ